ncbi:MAG: phytanoyl-CoA dioxygenase family protein [Planctomycetota bacterium]|nr:phytanoyl-CoA dioxygenase family protein [Planctomycetota bacterium]
MKQIFQNGLSANQRLQFDDDGFVLIENALGASEIDNLVSIADRLHQEHLQRGCCTPDEPFQMRDIPRLDKAFLEMVTHPIMLPLIVDAIGFNIQIRTSHMDVRPPQSPEAGEKGLGAKDSFFPWHSDGPNFGWPQINGQIPFMEVKVGYYLTDLAEHNSGAICVARGSHRESVWIERDGETIVDPDRVYEVNVRPGTAMLWRTALLHCLTPNLSPLTRKCLYFGYTHRWVRPSDYMHQPPELIENCNPIQRQLLGELGTGKANYVGDDPSIQPVSRFWRPEEEDIPLKAWAEDRGLPQKSSS